MGVIIPAGFRWSYSKQGAFERCPLSFRLEYLDETPQAGNAFGEYGTLCHSLLEEWANGMLPTDELPGEFDSRYATAVCHPFPPFPKDMAGKYHAAGLRYFQSFEGFGQSQEILGVEEKFVTTIGGYAFSGVADLILRNVKDGSITVVDHKTKSPASMRKDLAASKKQLYVYAAFVKEKYGEYPALLRFNMIRDGGFIDEAFNPEAFSETMAWIGDTIDLVLLEDEWQASCSSYFCQFVCGVRHYCPLFAEPAAM